MGQLLGKVEPDIDWEKDIRTNCVEYLKLMTGYGMPVVEIDPQKDKSLFP